ncbi:MAG: ThuA domain-containing protein, partial [Planctomycetaceae bacterium]|nr:ThuA domain-containing protein [Planctomycetaceae bacterium]
MINSIRILFRIPLILICLFSYSVTSQAAEERLVFEPSGKPNGKRIVLVSGDEEYRTEETMPMLAKILSQHHGFHCTVLFSFGPEGADYIDPNNSQGLRGLEALNQADLMIIGTRFRTPDANGASYITKYLNAGKPIIGIRTSTHAFNGNGDFGGVPFGQFGLKMLGETWVSHHGRHKQQGARGLAVAEQKSHPILSSVSDIFCPSDVYGVIHLSDADQILLRGAVTETLDPASPQVEGEQNNPMQPFAWLHTYESPDGKAKGKSFCTTGGASVDFVDENLRRLIVNAAYFLTGQKVPASANVEFVDAYYPSFYGFIRDQNYWKNLNLKPSTFALGQSPQQPDPAGSPAWPYRDKPEVKSAKGQPFEFRDGERVALVGSSLAERMNLFGYFESILHTRFAGKKLVVRNFGWPADEVGNQQRPDNYTQIDNPMVEFGPELFICFFGFNEHFAGADESQLNSFKDRYRSWIEEHRQK